MTIIINECCGSDNRLLKLLASYQNIQTMLKDADTEKIDLPYLDIWVGYNNKLYSFRRNGEDCPNRKKWIREMTKIPLYKRRIPNDTMIIKCDEFERELYIDLDGK